MNDIKGGNDVVLFGNPLRSVQLLETHSLCHPSLLRQQSRMLNRRTIHIVSNEVRIGIGLCKLYYSAPATTAHIGECGPSFQSRMHFRHQWHPDGDEQALEPGIGEAFLSVPGDVVIGGLVNGASIP